MDPIEAISSAGVRSWLARFFSRVARALQGPSRPARRTRFEHLAYSDDGFDSVAARCESFTLTGRARMYALWSALRHLDTARVPGDLVECGVWRGGSAMLMALAHMESHTPHRNIWLYDTFSGMTDPGDTDVDLEGRPAGEAEGSFRTLRERTAAGVDEVRRNMTSTGYPSELVRFVEGDVTLTIATTAPDQIALLRLDTDWYESTKAELEMLYPRLTPGGVLIIDDYGHWQGARRATDEYLSGLQRPPLLVPVDYTARVAVKPF